MTLARCVRVTLPGVRRGGLNAGYSRGAVLEVVAQVVHTTMANLAHGISQAPVDQAFAAQAWAAA